jgi:predicted negative regulator of RcsB-dependent stress response
MRNPSQADRRAPFPAEILHGSRAGTFLVCAAAASLFLVSGIPGAFAQQNTASADASVPKNNAADASKTDVPKTDVPKSVSDAAQNAATTQGQGPENPVNLYPDKESGDRARTDMEYGTAASFYRQYRAKAELNGDAKAVKDAYACELDALILANLADPAQKLLDEYRSRIPQLDEKSVSLWQAEIYLIRRNADEADKLLQKLIPSLENLDPVRLRAISCAAFVAELKGDQEQAAKYYGDLAAAPDPLGVPGVKTAFGRRAAERQVLALAALGRFMDAYDLLKTLPQADNKRDVDAHRLLSFYLTLGEKGEEGFESLADTWSEIRSISTPRKDNFFFLAACRIGDEFLRRGETVRAAEAFHLAYGFAAVREDAFTAMKRLMNAFDRLGQKKEAAELAMRMVSFFKDVQLSPDFKLRIASVLFRAGRTDDAFDVCLSCVSDASLPAAEREKTYRDTLDVMIREKAFESAHKFIDAFDTVPEKKAARAMDRAEVTWRENKPAEAAKLYRAVGESSKEFRQEALLNAMRCCQDAGQYQDMLDIAASLRKDDPAHPAPDMLLLSAVAQFHLRDMAAAAQNYLDYEASVTKTDANRKNREDALFQAGQLLSGLGQPEKAAEVFRRLCQNYGRNDGTPRYWLIHCLYASGDEIGAERESWRFIEEKPDSQYAGAAMLRLAEHYRGTGSVQHAESTLNQLLDQEKYPRIQARAIYEKALIAFQRDDLTTALEHLDRIDVSEPQNAPMADIHYLRGDIARAMDDFAKARIEYEAAAKDAAGTRLKQAALGSAADCIYAMAASPAPKTAAAPKNAAAVPKDAVSAQNNKPQAGTPDKDNTKDVQDGKEKEKDKGKEAQAVKPAEEKPATPADNYREAYRAYQALLKLNDLLPEYKAMATYKSGQSLWKAGDEKEAFDLFRQMIYLVPARDAAARPVEAFWVFRAVEALEALAHKDPVLSNVESAVAALVWLGQTGMADQASVRQRIRALRKKQYQPPLPASSTTTTTPESSQS